MYYVLLCCVLREKASSAYSPNNGLSGTEEVTARMAQAPGYEAEK